MTLALCLNFASLISIYSARYDIDPQIVHKVMFAESSCRETARTDKDLGLMQIRRGITTRGYDSLTDLQLMRPRLNIKLGVRRLARAKRICGGDELRWLSNYAGLKCGVSIYSICVVYGRTGEYNSEISGPPTENSTHRSSMLKGE